MLLPDKNVTFQYGAPCAECGEKFFYSDKGDDLDNTMTRDVEGGGALTAKVRYAIEEGWDYAFLEASSDGGETWTPVHNNLSYKGEDQSGFNGSGAGISGTSQALGRPDRDSARRHQRRPVALPDRWRAALNGFQVDNVTLDGQFIGGAETDEEGWALDGFRRSTPAKPGSSSTPTSSTTGSTSRDKLLRHVYNFGYNNARRWSSIRYNPGALISYWDTSFTDNNVGDHPGGGEILPVDAHPSSSHAPDGSILRPRTRS